MGEAKRAPFEVRKAQAIAREQEAAAKRVQEHAAREAALTPAQRKQRQRSQMLLATMVGLTAGLRR